MRRLCLGCVPTRLAAMAGASILRAGAEVLGKGFRGCPHGLTGAHIARCQSRLVRPLSTTSAVPCCGSLKGKLEIAHCQSWLLRPLPATSAMPCCGFLAGQA